MSNSKPVSRNAFIITAALLVVLMLGISTVIGQQLVQADGRLNQITHFGGDALYCMDASDNVTNDSSTFDHFQLLSASGQPLWSLSRQIVEEGLGQIRPGGTAVQLGHGQGSYGPVDLYGNAADDGSPYFIFIGFDEYGKENRLIFYGCTPTGSALSPTIAVTPTQLPV